MPDDHDSPPLAKGKPAFEQDPHRVRELSERNLEVAIGREVRAFRRQQGMTVADLAGVTGLSIGMLSKIENGVTSPSLTTLQILSHAFSTPITSFLRRFEERREVQRRPSIGATTYAGIVVVLDSRAQRDHIAERGGFARVYRAAGVQKVG